MGRVTVISRPPSTSPVLQRLSLNNMRDLKRPNTSQDVQKAPTQLTPSQANEVIDTLMSPK